MPVNQISKTAILATFGLALTLSCSSRNDDPVSEPVFYEGETYQTVVIGKQTWMARNLNYDAPGSICYDNDPANCAIYGRLYNWVIAMALPEECEESECADQMKTPHQGICPDGWHVSSNEDWEELETYVTNKKGGQVARHLKAKNVWYIPSSQVVTDGKDSFGFAALPGGFGFGDASGNGKNIGDEGNWWTSSEDSIYEAFSWRMENYLVDMLNFSHWKTHFYSVRCVKD